MRTRSSWFLGLVSTLIAPLAIAHEPDLPPTCQVDSPLVVVVSSFNFSPAQLSAYKQATPAPGTESACQEKDCGIVDDWYWANRMASEHCNGGAQRSTATPNRMSHVALPTYFYDHNDIYDGTAHGSNGIQDHHDRYRFSDGLKGVCVACPTTGTTSGSVSRTITR